MKARQVLGLDLASYTGYAHSCGESGVWDLSIRKDESSGMRLLRFRGKLRELIEGVGVDVIAYEVPSVARGKNANLDALKLQTKLQAILEEICEGDQPHPELVGYNLQTIKAYALKKHPHASGKRDKESMIAAAKKEWPGIEILNDDHADALWVLQLYRYLVSGGGTFVDMAATPATAASQKAAAKKQGTKRSGKKEKAKPVKQPVVAKVEDEMPVAVLPDRVEVEVEVENDYFRLEGFGED